MNQPNEDQITHSKAEMSSFFKGSKEKEETPNRKKTERLEKKALNRTINELTNTSTPTKRVWLNDMMSNLLIQAHEKRSVVEPDSKNIMHMKLLDLNSKEAGNVNKNRLARITKGGAHDGTIVLKKLDRDKTTNKICRIRRGIYIGGEETTGGSIPFSFIYPFLVDAYQLTLQGQGFAVESLLQDSEFTQILELLGDLTGEITSDVFRHNKKRGGLLEFDGEPGKKFTVRTVSNDFNGQYQTPLKLVSEYYRDLVASTTPQKLKEFEKQLKHFENAHESLVSRDAPKAKVDIALERIKTERALFDERKQELKQDDFVAKARFILDLRPEDPIDENVTKKVNEFNKWLNKVFREGMFSTVPGSKYEETVDRQIEEFSKISKIIAELPGTNKLLTLSILYSRFKNAQTTSSGGLGTFMMKALVSQYGEFVRFNRDGNQVTITVDIEKLLENWTKKAEQTIQEIIEELQQSPTSEHATKLLEKFPEKNYAIIKLLLERMVIDHENLLTKFQSTMVGAASWKIQEIKDLITIISKKEGIDKNPEELINMIDFKEYLEPIVGETLAPLLSPEEESPTGVMAEPFVEESQEVQEAPLSPIEEVSKAPTLSPSKEEEEEVIEVKPLQSSQEQTSPTTLEPEKKIESQEEIISVSPMKEETEEAESSQTETPKEIEGKEATER